MTDGRYFRRVTVFMAVAAVLGPALAHVNSPHVYAEKELGGYPLVIIVHMPQAIPGEAEVIVRLQDRAPDDEVTVSVREIPPQGEAHAPPWDSAEPVEGDAESFTAPLPLMVYGVWNAEIRVEGDRGEGSTRVPIPARVAAPREMSTGLVVTLVALIAILFASVFQTLRSIGSDGHRPETGTRTAADARRGLIIGVIGVVAFGGFIGFTVKTWAMFDGLAERRSVPPLRSRLQALSGPTVAGNLILLRLQVTGHGNRPVTDVVRDRGKWMHAVVVSEPDASYFLKVHPERSGPGAFGFEFTPPEAGTYRLFADVMFASGETETVTGTIEIGPGRPTGATTLADPDDAQAITTGPASGGERSTSVGDGLTMRWASPERLRAGEFARMEFELVDDGGRPVSGLEPYLGTAGHLTVLRDDLGVFARVYPGGTLGKAAEPGADGTLPAGPAAAFPPRVSFPYGFPEAGRYRLFVQMRHEGRVVTGVFAAEVGG